MEQDVTTVWEEESEMVEYPLLAVRDAVVFPHMMIPLFVGRDRSLRAVDEALDSDHCIMIVTQKEPEIRDPAPEDMYSVGTVATIARTLRMPDGTTSILVEGLQRARVVEYTQTDGFYRVRTEPIFDDVEEQPLTEALMRAALALFEKCVQLSRSLPEDAFVTALNAEDAGWLADVIAFHLTLDIEERQEILETLDPVMRLQKLSVLLAKELDVLELEDQIQSQVQEEVDKSQREYVLREQMRIIQNELGEMDPLMSEKNELRDKIAATKMPAAVREKAEKELSRLDAMPPMSPETGVIRTYLDWLIDLPWTKETRDKADVSEVARLLDREHYGLPKAKERIVEYMAVRKLAGKKMRSPILCFVGPPGTGKTSLGRSIAKALGRSFVRVSLGGIRDEAEIRGHRRTYIGALPGRIIQTMRRAKSINPVFMLDEIDKVGSDFRGDPAAALLEVLDPEQNNAFSDHYLDVDYDLSKVMFITTANILDTVTPALEDRMEVIEFPGYVEEEKVEIAKRFLIPRQIEENGLKELRFSDQALRSMIREYSYEAGVRNLERTIATICRKVARTRVEGRRAPRLVTLQSLLRYLGPPRYTYGIMEENDEVGLATGIAWTAAGGDTMSVEVTLMEGKGNLILTGQLGDVMQESAQAALSYTRSHATDLGVEKSQFDKLDIHIHVPEGAIPKDGPSAGITIATALVSALSRRPVHREVGMTGEITLRGRVLGIGGLKEKVLAAHRAGLKKVLLPKKNEMDLQEIPRKVRKDLEFIFVERMDEVLPVALMPPPPTKRRKRPSSGATS
ncbi:MAG TPA: endopeptidase La [Anaerolineae bacterium]|nr:endopeptidase La [Anaerolineae bacterium]